MLHHRSIILLVALFLLRALLTIIYVCVCLFCALKRNQTLSENIYCMIFASKELCSFSVFDFMLRFMSCILAYVTEIYHRYMLQHDQTYLLTVSFCFCPSNRWIDAFYFCIVCPSVNVCSGRGIFRLVCCRLLVVFMLISKFL